MSVEESAPLRSGQHQSNILPAALSPLAMLWPELPEDNDAGVPQPPIPFSARLRRSHLRLECLVEPAYACRLKRNAFAMERIAEVLVAVHDLDCIGVFVDGPWTFARRGVRER